MHSIGLNDKGDQDILHDVCNVVGVKHNEHEDVVSKYEDIEDTIEDVSIIMVVYNILEY